jgi:hypothetical protein
VRSSTCRLAAALEADRTLLVVWTTNSVDSRWVRGEAREAANRGAQKERTIAIAAQLGNVEDGYRRRGKWRPAADSNQLSL